MAGRLACVFLSALLCWAADPLPKFTTVSHGPNWQSGSEDGGSGSLGITQSDVDKDGWVQVKWLNGKVGLYRYGAGGEFAVKKQGAPDPKVQQPRQEEALSGAVASPAATTASLAKTPATAATTSATSDSLPESVPAESLQVNQDLFMASRVSGIEATTRIQDLITAGAYVNVQIVHGWTPLHMAMVQSYDNPAHDPIPATKALLDARADVNIRDGAGRTPLYYATKKNSAPVVELFKDTEELKAPRPGFSPMERAVKDGHAVSIEALLHFGHDLEKDRSFSAGEVRRLLKQADMLDQTKKGLQKDRLPARTRRLLEEAPKTETELEEERAEERKKQEMKRPEPSKKVSEL